MMQNCKRYVAPAVIASLTLLVPAVVAAQGQEKDAPASQPAPAPVPVPVPVPEGEAPPAGYVIGVDDVLNIKFWSDERLSGDAFVRPDGRITLPLLGDVQAVGYTPQQLSVELEKAASKYINDPDATVIVKEVRSRKVFVLGQGIAKPGVVPMNSDMNVLQLIAAAGGVLEWADKGNIVIIRNENGRERRFRFNYNDVVRGRNVEQNIPLLPNDTVLVN